MNSLSFVLASLTTGWITLGTAAVLRLTSSRREAAGRPVSPVSVLKPLCGADPSLRENLESFFVQDHPSYELIFGVERADDPAIPVVEDLIAQHPTVRARIVVHVPPRGENPKVRNLRGIVGHASFDLVLISDSNVRAPRGYLTDAVRELESHPDNGLVTNLFVGSGGGTLGAALEAVQLTGFCTSTAPPITKASDGSHAPKKSRKPRTFSGRVMPASASPRPKIAPEARATTEGPRRLGRSLIARPP